MRVIRKNWIWKRVTDKTLMPMWVHQKTGTAFSYEAISDLSAVLPSRQAAIDETKSVLLAVTGSYPMWMDRK